MRYANSREGELSVVVAPVLRFMDVGFNANIRLEEVCWTAEAMRMATSSCAWNRNMLTLLMFGLHGAPMTKELSTAVLVSESQPCGNMLILLMFRLQEAPSTKKCRRLCFMVEHSCEGSYDAACRWARLTGSSTALRRSCLGCPSMMRRFSVPRPLPRTAEPTTSGALQLVLVFVAKRRSACLRPRPAVEFDWLILLSCRTFAGYSSYIQLAVVSGYAASSEQLLREEECFDSLWLRG